MYSSFKKTRIKDAGTAIVSSHHRRTGQARHYSSIDFIVVPTVRFAMLYVLVFLSIDRRRGVTRCSSDAVDEAFSICDDCDEVTKREMMGHIPRDDCWCWDWS